MNKTDLPDYETNPSEPLPPSGADRPVIRFFSRHATGHPLRVRRNKRRTTKPTLHFRPQDAKAGDVIPFYWKGDYHLFYLKGPDWAHVVSRDLLRWQELPNALIKGSDLLGPDWESIWTGSVVEHGGTFYLFYTGKTATIRSAIRK